MASQVSIVLPISESSGVPVLGGTLISLAEVLTFVGSDCCVEIQYQTNSQANMAKMNIIASMAGEVTGVTQVSVCFSESKFICIYKQASSQNNIKSFAYESPNSKFDSPLSLMSAGYSAETISPPIFENATYSKARAGISPEFELNFVLNGNFMLSPSENEIRQSIYDSMTWARAIRKCLQEFPRICFHLVGTGVDSILEELSESDSVFDARAELSTELALIQIADAFVGTSTGPSTVAILGTKPYFIMKHPDHHEEEILKILEGDSFSKFAAEKQRFVRGDGVFPELETQLRDWIGSL